MAVLGHYVAPSPGTGKTTVVRAAVNGIAAISKRPIFLAAPTGKAARRLMEATGQSASTIHRLLGYSSALGGFWHHQHNPFNAGSVIVDEASMVDLALMADLLAALPKNCRLVLVGDPDQLPPVSFGQPFTDMLASGRFPVIRLSAILRQSEGSTIAQVCQAIREGHVSHLPSYTKGLDLSLLKVPDADATSALAEVVKDVIQGGCNPFTGLQVLAPMKNRTCGVHCLNELLAQICNPAGDVTSPTCRLAGGTGSVGDKVQQLVNNYDKGVFNGDQGRIVEIAHKPFGGLRIAVLFGNRDVPYTATEAAAELALAYAITIHRSQGSG